MKASVRASIALEALRKQIRADIMNRSEDGRFKSMALMLQPMNVIAILAKELTEDGFDVSPEGVISWNRSL